MPVGEGAKKFALSPYTPGPPLFQRRRKEAAGVVRLVGTTSAGEPAGERLKALHDHSASCRPHPDRDLAHRRHSPAEKRGRRARHGGWRDVRIYDRPLDGESPYAHDGDPRRPLHGDESLTCLVQQSRPSSAIYYRAERAVSAGGSRRSNYPAAANAAHGAVSTQPPARALSGRFVVGAQPTSRWPSRPAPGPVTSGIFLGDRRLML
jgi:hypothetical protein